MRKHKVMRREFLFAVLLLLVAVFTPLAQEQKDCIVRLTLLQLNDVYQFEPVDQGATGGIARVMTLKKEVQKTSPNTLFLLAGDTISPSVESITYKGAQMIDAWNTAGVDYATFGNHEFDFGPDVLKQRMQESKFKWIAANVIDTTTGKPFGGADAFVIREFDGVKVGIFGLVLPETKVTSRPGPNVDFASPCETAKRIVPQIRAQGAKVVIALTHMSMGEDKEVARCAKVDVIIGGHEHTLLESSSGGAPIFKMTADARELGKIDLNISKKSGEVQSIDWKVIPVTPKTTPDPQFAAVTKKYAGLLRELVRQVGRTNVELNAKSASNRTEETNVGDLVTDAFRRATASEVALMNGGSVRADAVIGPGILTRRDILGILPFKNRVVKLEITGAVLREALEHGVSRSREDSEPGGFPQISGVRFTFDASRPAGSRIVSATVNGQPLEDNRKYTLATTNFIAIDGGDGYAMFKNSRLLITPERGQIDSDILAKAVALRPVSAKTDGRIKRLDQFQRQRSDCKD